MVSLASGNHKTDRLRSKTAVQVQRLIGALSASDKNDGGGESVGRQLPLCWSRRRSWGWSSAGSLIRVGVTLPNVIDLGVERYKDSPAIGRNVIDDRRQSVDYSRRIDINPFCRTAQRQYVSRRAAGSPLKRNR